MDEEEGRGGISSRVRHDGCLIISKSLFSEKTWIRVDSLDDFFSSSSSSSSSIDR